jgi:hypothetical protein
VPTEVWNVTPDGQTPVVGDTRRITYWLIAGEGGQSGLARNEIKVATSPDSITAGTTGTTGTDLMPTNVDLAKAVIAPEVRSVKFRYFDGTEWQDSWDSTTLGADTITPIGSPRAIEITLGIARPGSKNAEPKTFRQVIFLPTANGTTQQPTTPEPIGAGITSP